MTALADRCRRGWHFAHGDVTARNVLRDAKGRLWLVDWERAGLYPPAYDLAFLWFSCDVPGARARVRASVPEHYEAPFVLSATLVQLLHLQMWTVIPNPFAPNHRRTLAELLEDVERMSRPR